MNKTKISLVDMDFYTEKLDNGLDVYLLPITDKKKYYISYTTRFGSDVLSFELDDGESFTPPLGIAHFLEHKMFEMESGEDPFSYFSRSGTDANAATSYTNTRYICTGTKNFSDNLRYLLRLVNSPYFTDDNVNKEKGIIAEEIKMYDDYPDYKLECELRDCLYKKSPRKYDIAGSVDSINNITRDDLYRCYNAFYRPDNMFILIVGNFDVDSTIDIIHEELDNTESSTVSRINYVKEPSEVNKSNLVIKNRDIDTSKLGVGIKVPIKSLKLKGVLLDLYLNMITNILFGSSSEFRERVRREGILNNISCDWEYLDGYRTYYILSTTKDPDRLLEEIKYELDNLSIAESAFNRIKKVWVANEVKMLDDINIIVDNFSDDIIRYNKVITDRIDLIKDMSIDKLDELLKEIDFSNISVVKMISGEESKFKIN